MDFTALRKALNRTYSHEACVEILKETAICYREQTPMRWYILLVNRIFARVIDNPDLFEADHVDPIWETICREGLHGISAIVAGDAIELTTSGDRLTEAYCAIP
jgi:hypothetical protein